MSLKTYARKDEVVKHYWAVSLKKNLNYQWFEHAGALLTVMFKDRKQG